MAYYDGYGRPYVDVHNGDNRGSWTYEFTVLEVIQCATEARDEYRQKYIEAKAVYDDLYAKFLVIKKEYEDQYGRYTGPVYKKNSWFKRKVLRKPYYAPEVDSGHPEPPKFGYSAEDHRKWFRAAADLDKWIVRLSFKDQEERLRLTQEDLRVFGIERNK